MSSCKACGAVLLWFRTPEGRSMPCDAVPLEVLPPVTETVILALPNQCMVALPGARPKYYRPHWVTCPKADEFRRSRQDGNDQVAQPGLFPEGEGGSET